MTTVKYVIVAAGAVNERNIPLVSTGDLIFVKPTSQAFWRGAPVPTVLPLREGEPTPHGATLLGILDRPPLSSGSNFGVPLAVLTLIVQGQSHLRKSAIVPSDLHSSAWQACGKRRVYITPDDPVHSRALILA